MPDPLRLSAHTPPDGGAEFHGLVVHLREVAALAERFAAKFGYAELGHLLGLTHDLAKADPRFQAYLRACHEGKPAARCPHSAPSAAAVDDRLGLLALAVLGHHVGLKSPAEAKQDLLAADPGSVAAARRLWASLDALEFDVAASFAGRSRLECELLVRMLFSCLVDADYLDTERHFQADAASRRGAEHRLEDLCVRLDAHLAALASTGAGHVHEVRQAVLRDCRRAAQGDPGRVNRLAVPTGGGKTLSSLAFALEHARVHGLDRVIVAIPYTSIIDQTAQVFEGVFGPGPVVEHHSAIESPPEQDEDQGVHEVRQRLAAENWDAPIIVTTTVQLFESLFSRRPSRCRKLHNIARSVLVLDEVQTLPVTLLEPVLDALGQLCAHYGCSVVLCTATQPDFSALEDTLAANVGRLLSEALEIVPESHRHFESLRRVRYEFRSEPMSAEEVARRMQAEHQVLCVLNTRKDAVRVLKALMAEEGVAGEEAADAGIAHLSTLMCPHHRKAVLAEVRRRLERNEPIRLVATQVVEAGVDLDFPVVMRDLGPLDRIVQVAGRCNREGRLAAPGRCLVFRLEGGATPKGSYASACRLAETILRERPEDFDLPDSFREFFGDLYGAVETDPKGIQGLREQLHYPRVEAAFRMIDDDTRPVIVEGYRPAGDPAAVENLLADWGRASPRSWFRRATQFSVATRQHEYGRMHRERFLREHSSGVTLYDGPYDEVFGMGNGTEPDPADLIIG